MRIQLDIEKHKISIFKSYWSGEVWYGVYALPNQQQMAKA